MKPKLVALILVVITGLFITPIVHICVRFHLFPWSVLGVLGIWWFVVVIVTLCLGWLYPIWYVRLYTGFCLFWIFFCYLIWGAPGLGSPLFEMSVFTGVLGPPTVLAPLIPLWYWLYRGKQKKSEVVTWELQDQLKELNEQVGKEVITLEEFEQKKKKMMSKEVLDILKVTRWKVYDKLHELLFITPDRVLVARLANSHMATGTITNFGDIIGELVLSFAIPNSEITKVELKKRPSAHLMIDLNIITDKKKCKWLFHSPDIEKKKDVEFESYENMFRSVFGDKLSVKK